MSRKIIYFSLWQFYFHLLSCSWILQTQIDLFVWWIKYNSLETAYVYSAFEMFMKLSTYSSRRKGTDDIVPVNRFAWCRDVLLQNFAQAAWKLNLQNVYVTSSVVLSYSVGLVVGKKGSYRILLGSLYIL